MLPNSILAIVLAFTATALAADQGPEVSGPLTLQYRPHSNFETCRSSGSKTNCGFCYGSGGTFQGWNCACDTFVSTAQVGDCGERNQSSDTVGSALELRIHAITFWNRVRRPGPR